MKTISIIIIAKNQLSFLKQTIPLLKKQKLAEKLEIIVMDSSSTDGTLSYLAKENVKTLIYDSPHFNFGRAFNLAAEQAKGDILIRLSGDVIPLQISFVEQITKPFLDEGVGATYGKYVISGKKGFDYPDFWPASRFPSKETRYHVKPQLFEGVRIFGWDLNRSKTGSVFNLAGGCCAIRTSIWKNRPFNEELMGGEDAEYAWYLHAAGYDIVYVPEAEVLHEHEKRKQSGPTLDNLLPTWQLVFNWQIIKLTFLYFFKRL